MQVSAAATVSQQAKSYPAVQHQRRQSQACQLLSAGHSMTASARYNTGHSSRCARSATSILTVALLQSTRPGILTPTHAECGANVHARAVLIYAIVPGMLCNRR
jgi:hypothetical protein